MTSLSVAAASALTAPSSAARSVLPAGGASVQSGASSSASTFVTLGRSGAVADATNMQTYSASGAVSR
ncbi:hypothetical protein [Herbaspirillum sp. RV1423]|uniref:hypothetical protein n=1 Tax=Herbaspirillum sp. RV1423 TaxID=1443993 RepID=UPI0018CBFAD5|nr:hypothetical protein [Herbaspirillum sp. RV1423]